MNTVPVTVVRANRILMGERPHDPVRVSRLAPRLREKYAAARNVNGRSGEKATTVGAE
jgi:hypothetical protein